MSKRQTPSDQGAIVMTPWMLAAALLIGGATAYAQSPSPGAAAPSRRDDVKMMEVILTDAVKRGADNLGRQMQISEPGSLIVTGTARARGFILDGYGIFFNVDVPMMKQSVAWSSRTLLREKYREDLRQFIATNPDSPARRQAEVMLRNLERSLGPVPSQSQPAQPSTVANSTTVSTLPPPGMASAQTVPEVAAITAPPDFRDPNELYTEAVKTALIDAMLKIGPQLIRTDEWLTVAAQDAEGPLPGQIYDASTIVLRVKGSDLAAFQAGKLTRDEVLAKVEVREF